MTSAVRLSRILTLCFLVRFEIVLNDQCVLVPRSSESSDSLWLDIGAAKIQNTFYVNVRSSRHSLPSI